MPSVTVDLGAPSNLSLQVFWGVFSIDLGDTFSATEGVDQALSHVRISLGFPADGQVQLELVGSQADFTPAFEAAGILTFEASDGETLAVMIANADTDEPYTWIPSNSAEVVAFANHLMGLTDKSTTLTLTLVGPTPNTPAAPTLIGTEDSITAVGVEPDDNGNAITSYDWRIKRTSSGIWADRLDQTSLTQTWTSLQPDTEYEVQFRATNSEGDSAYSPSGILTTDMQTTPPVGFTDIPRPVSGDEWDLNDWLIYVVDNINAIHALQTGNVPGTTFAENDVVIGDTGGALQGVDLPNGALLVGSTGLPVALTIGSTGQRLRAVNGVLTWVTHDPSLCGPGHTSGERLF